MKLPVVFLAFFFLFSLVCTGQDNGFGTDFGCSPGVYPNNAPGNLIRSTVLFNVHSNGFADNRGVSQCTGTLLNQNIGGELRQLLLTARHCIHGGALGGGTLLPLNALSLVFNFQSNNGDNNSIPENAPFILGNRGAAIPNLLNRYAFRTTADLIYESDALLSPIVIFGNNIGYGIDIALLQINTPIPPHFNPYFAGWKPDDLSGQDGFFNAPMRVVHHPSGDAKKVSTTYQVYRLNNTVATGCRTVTKVIDWIVRLFGGRSVTEIACNYLDIPQYVIPLFTSGSSREGSSGSGAFTSAGRVFGVTSAGFSECANIANTLGKFKNAYANREMRGYLNPPDLPEVNNIFGIDGRDLSCYNANPLRLSGNYYPARDYQPDNQIVIHATQNIEAGAVNSDGNAAVVSTAARVGAGGAITPPTGTGIEETLLRIYTGADFTFTAGGAIRLLPGFSVDAGATFTARIEGCAPLRQMLSTPPLQTASSVRAPLPPAETLPAEETEMLTVQPNPTTGPVQGRYRVRQPGPVSVQVVAADGRVVRSVVSLSEQQPGLYYFGTDLAELPTGLYIMQLQTQTDKAAGRVVLTR